MSTSLFEPPAHIAADYSPDASVTLFHGDAADLIATLPDQSVRLIVTSPPYNLGKEYENKVSIVDYLGQQAALIAQFWRILADDGGICWQVGNFVEDGEVYPLDILYYDIFKRLKSNHPEKTIHPCQFPIELVERCVLALTNEGDLVFDPFAGVGSSLIGALMHRRRAAGSEREGEYVAIARERINAYFAGALKVRPLGKPVHQPSGREKVSQVPPEWQHTTTNNH